MDFRGGLAYRLPSALPVDEGQETADCRRMYRRLSSRYSFLAFTAYLYYEELRSLLWAAAIRTHQKTTEI